MSSIVAVNGADIWYMIWHAGIIVQFVLFLLVMFSVLSWAIIFTKNKAVYNARKENIEFEKIFWNSDSLSVVFNQTKHLVFSPLVVLFRLGYIEIGKVIRAQGKESSVNSIINQGIIENLSRALSRAQAAESTRLGRTVTFLATTANTAPFIGLFGTVWGIMDSFRSIGASNAATLGVVAPGIAEALIATATGLFAAIPAVVFYNYFNRRLQVLENEMTAFAQDFLNLVERDLIYRSGLALESVEDSSIVENLGGI